MASDESFTQRSAVLWLIVALLAFIALALNAWRRFVEHDAVSWTSNLVSIIVIALAVINYRRIKQSAPKA